MTNDRLFKEVNVQKHTQATRYLVFKLLDALLAKYRPALVKLGSSFINGFIKAVDGEKDPRNLLLVFAMSRVIALEFDITTHVEDLFDVTFCYFPITFRPPPDDPYGITADDLRNSLRKSLAASPLYGPLAMPLLLEKLTSTSGPAKKDSLETLNACIPVYGASAVNEVMKTLVDNLRYEVINSGEDLVETLALQVIKTTVATVSDLGTEIAPPPTLLVLLRMLLDDAADQLKEPDQKMAKPAGRILAVAASASVIACAEVVVEVVPVLLSQLDESDLAVRKKAILEILSEFLNASAECFGSRTNEITREQQNPLFEYKDQLYIACTRALKASTEYPGLRLAGLAGLRAMLSLRDYLDDSESAMTVQILDDVLLKNIEDEELKTETLAVLVHVATFSPHHIVDLTLPFLLATLPTSKEDLDFAQAMGLKAQYHSVLASLSNFSAEQPIFDTLVSSLLHKLAHIATYPMDDISYPKAVCSTLLDMLKIKAAKKDPSIPELKDSLAMPLLRTCIAASLGLDELSPASCMAQVEILQDIAGMHMLIARSLDVNQQGILMRGIVWAFKDGDLNALEFDDLALPGVKFQPLSPAAPYAQQNISPIFASVVGSCRRDVELPIQDVCAFLETLAKDSVTTENEEQRLAYLRTIGSMVNKVQDSSKLDAFLSGPIKSLWDGISSVDEKQRRPRMLLYAWIIKGLVLRSHNAGYQMLDNIVKAMQDGFDFAEAFQVIVTPDEQVLNRQSFADVRLLYQQRLFNFLLPRLLNGFKTARSNPDTDSLATKYLIAMTYVLKHVPKQLLVNEITLVRKSTSPSLVNADMFRSCCLCYCTPCQLKTLNSNAQQ